MQDGWKKKDSFVCIECAESFNLSIELSYMDENTDIQDDAQSFVFSWKF